MTLTLVYPATVLKNVGSVNLYLENLCNDQVYDDNGVLRFTKNVTSDCDVRHVKI
jgi:hypothetical protein